MVREASSGRATLDAKEAGWARAREVRRNSESEDEYTYEYETEEESKRASSEACSADWGGSEEGKARSRSGRRKKVMLKGRCRKEEGRRDRRTRERSPSRNQDREKDETRAGPAAERDQAWGSSSAWGSNEKDWGTSGDWSSWGWGWQSEIAGGSQTAGTPKGGRVADRKAAIEADMEEHGVVICPKCNSQNATWRLKCYKCGLARPNPEEILREHGDRHQSRNAKRRGGGKKKKTWQDDWTDRGRWTGSSSSSWTDWSWKNNKYDDASGRDRNHPFAHGGT